MPAGSPSTVTSKKTIGRLEISVWLGTNDLGLDSELGVRISFARIGIGGLVWIRGALETGIGSGTNPGTGAKPETGGVQTNFKT